MKYKAKSFLEPIQAGSADSILASMWRQICRDYGIEETKLDDLVTKYSETLPDIPQDQRIHAAGNLKNELVKTEITWKTFIRAMRTLKTGQLEMLLQLQHLNSTSDHYYRINIGGENNKEIFNTIEPEGSPYPQNKDEIENIPEKILGDFYSKILFELGVNMQKFEELMLNYMRRSMLNSDAHNRSHIRGNIKKELFGKSMSWRSFIKGLNFIRVLSFTFYIRIHRVNGEHSDHKKKFVINDPEDLN